LIDNLDGPCKRTVNNVPQHLAARFLQIVGSADNDDACWIDERLVYHGWGRSVGFEYNRFSLAAVNRDIQRLIKTHMPEIFGF
jgi:hypothetical protein